MIPRRLFLRNTALGGASFLILKSARSAWTAQANEKLNVALIGVGGRGEWFVDTIPKLENVVALCDVNAQKLAGAFQRWEDLAQRFGNSPNDWERRASVAYKRSLDAKPRIFRDFRKLLDEMGKSLDAVVVATPDHTHAVVSAAAIQAGKHVFCEKPLTRTLHESRALRELARKHNVATAMGNQGTYSGPFRRALELIRNGTLGEINPGWERVQWHVPARAEFPPITIAWYNGAAPGAREVRARLSADPADKERTAWEHAGTFIVGTQGSLHTTGHNMWFRLVPEERFEGVQRNRPEIVESSRDPEQDWAAACRGGKPGWSNFDYADALNEFLMLGNVATQFESTIEFDPVAMKVVNNPQADALLRCAYRTGWTL